MNVVANEGNNYLFWSEKKKSSMKRKKYRKMTNFRVKLILEKECDFFLGNIYNRLELFNGRIRRYR